MMDAKYITHSGLSKMATMLQKAFWNAFSWMNNGYIFIEISLKFVPKSPVDNGAALV